MRWSGNEDLVTIGSWGILQGPGPWGIFGLILGEVDGTKVFMVIRVIWHQKDEKALLDLVL